MRNDDVSGKTRVLDLGREGARKAALLNQPESSIRRLRSASAVAFLAAFLMLSLTIGFSLHEVQQAHANLERIMAEHERKVRLITETQVASFRRADTVQMLMLETDPFALDAVFMDYLHYGFQVGDGRNRIRALLPGAEEQAILARQDAIIAAAVVDHDLIADLSRAGQQEEAREIFTSRVAKLHEEGHATFQALRDLQTAAAGHAIEIANQRYRQTLNRSIIAISASFVISIGIGLLLHFGGDRILRRVQNNVRSLRYMATHDSLTGLLNRSALSHKIADNLKAARPFALLYMDLDGFKRANDEFGHQRGDEFLVMAAARIRSRMRGVDVVARIGGDEFAAMMNDVSRAEECEHAARHVIDAFASPLVRDHAAVEVGISIGIALAPADGASADAILRAADKAMYAAKSSGRNGYQFAPLAGDANVVDLTAN